MKSRTRILSGLGVVAVIGLAVAAWLILIPGPLAFARGRPVDLADYKGPSPTGVPVSLAGAPLLQRGEYLTRAADCAACHTVPGGKPFAGGRAFKLPFGTLYTPNITPDHQTGIGDWSDADFVSALHKGVGRGGKPLYPAFPYEAYTQLTDDDVLAIKAYLFSLTPVHQAPPANALKFPFNQRWLMTVWSAFYNPDKRFRPVPEQSAEWNRGAYLAEAAAHCGDCHTPRTLTQALNNRRKFAGGAAEGWLAYNITAHRLSGVGAWTPEELNRYLATGHSVGRGTASGPMAEVVDLSLSHLDKADIAALVTYLRTVPAVHSSALPDTLAGPAPAGPLLGVSGNDPGRHIFEGACASCHAWNGAGAIVSQAQLTGARAVNDPSATNVAQMILTGAGHPAGQRPYMPAFGAAYTDREVADVANYVTARFGSKPSRITPEQVARLRAQH